MSAAAPCKCRGCRDDFHAECERDRGDHDGLCDACLLGTVGDMLTWEVWYALRVRRGQNWTEEMYARIHGAPAPFGLWQREWLKDRLTKLIAEIDEVASLNAPAALRELADEIERPGAKQVEGHDDGGEDDDA